MRAAGATFEERACRRLERAGMRALSRNYTVRGGELDLVMLDGGTLVFVEVRYRRDAAHGDAAASVTPAKRARIVHAARCWLAAHAEHAGRSCRFDVIAYDGPADAARETWLRAAFDAG